MCKKDEEKDKTQRTSPDIENNEGAVSNWPSYETDVDKLMRALGL